MRIGIFIFLFFFIQKAILASEINSTKIILCGNKPIFGRIEKVMLVDRNIEIAAKLDTGATMASLSATNIRIKNHNKNPLVQFTLKLPNNQRKIILTEPFIGTTKILKRIEEKKDIKIYSIRPVINLLISVGKQQRVIKVNLTDRTHFRYALLLGSNAIKKFNALIDVSKTHSLRN